MTDSVQATRGYVLYVIGTYPLLTTTFIDRELIALSERGMDIRVVSLRRTNGRLSPQQADLMDDVRYVFPVPVWRVPVALLMAVVMRPLALSAVFFSLVGSQHPSERTRLRTAGHVVLGAYLWTLIRTDPPGHVHAHFVDRAATVAIVLAALFAVDYSATAHANDIYVDPIILPQKTTRARFVATCTGVNADHLRQAVPGAAVELVYHGLDCTSYKLAGERRGEPRRIVAVAQLKEKKGLTHLVSACRLLADRDVPYECVIIGEGPLRRELEEEIRAKGQAASIRLRGALPHAEVIEEVSSAALFVLPSVIAKDGDRDGLPNVILEAMALGKPVVATRVSAIPEAVVDGQTGLLVDPADAVQLADAISRLLKSPDLGAELGRRGQERVEELFDAGRNAIKLEKLLAAR